MGEHHPFRKVGEPHAAHQAPYFPGFPPVRLGEELLFIQVHPGFHVQLEGAFLAPLGQGAGSVPIGVVPLGEFQADEVAAVAGKVFPALAGADDVIRGAGQFPDVPRFGEVVPECPEGPDVCHRDPILSMCLFLSIVSHRAGPRQPKNRAPQGKPGEMRNDFSFSLHPKFTKPG